MDLKPEDWGNPVEGAWLPARRPVQAEVMALEISPERQLEQAVPNAIRDLIELTRSADSERVQLDAIKALLMLAGVGKREAEIEANDMNGDEVRSTIMRLLQERQTSSG